MRGNTTNPIGNAMLVVVEKGTKTSPKHCGIKMAAETVGTTQRRVAEAITKHGRYETDKWLVVTAKIGKPLSQPR